MRRTTLRRRWPLGATGVVLAGILAACDDTDPIGPEPVEGPFEVIAFGADGPVGYETRTDFVHPSGEAMVVYALGYAEIHGDTLRLPAGDLSDNGTLPPGWGLIGHGLVILQREKTEFMLRIEGWIGDHRALVDSIPPGQAALIRQAFLGDRS